MPDPTILLLAAGENSRFFPLNTATHKGALTLLGKPLVVRTLESLEANGFDHVILIVSPKDFDGKGLSGFLADYEFKKLKIEFVLQPEPRGMGDAVLRVRDKIDSSFAVIYPTLLNAGEQLRRAIDQAGKGGAIEVAYTEEPWLYGIITLDGKKVTGLTEKPAPGEEKSNLKQHEMYFLSHEFLPFLKDTTVGDYSFELAFDKYVQAFEVHAVEEVETLPSLKYPWHLFDFQQYLFSKLPSYTSPLATVAKTVVLDEAMGNIYIESGANIGHCARIVGPCFIGKDVVIGDFSLIRGSSFEQGSVVGVHSDVVRSIVMERSSMHNGFLGDSIVGPQVTIGAGFLTSNKRLDRQPIHVDVKGKKIDTGRVGFGTVIGQGTKIGVRVVTMPGKFIGTQALLYPNATIFSHVPHHATVKTKSNVEVVE